MKEGDRLVKEARILKYFICVMGTMAYHITNIELWKEGNKN